LLCTAVLGRMAFAQQEEESFAQAVRAEDCQSGSRCTISLRQLRAVRSANNSDAVEGDISVLMHKATHSVNAVPLAPMYLEAEAVPGGWGEAASWVDVHALEQPNSSVVDDTPPTLHSHSDLGGTIILYHQTNRRAAHSIMRHGFRPGRHGWCGGGIYFAISPWDTNKKAIDPESHKGYMAAVQP